MATRERHFILDVDVAYSVGIVGLSVEGLKGHRYWVYLTTRGPYTRVLEGWSAGTVQEARKEARDHFTKWLQESVITSK